MRGHCGCARLRTALWLSFQQRHNPQTGINKIPISNARADSVIIVNNQYLSDIDQLSSFKAKSLILINNRYLRESDLKGFLERGYNELE